MCSSPRLIAAYHALHRLSMPRHPPCALLRLISNSIYDAPLARHVIRCGRPRVRVRRTVLIPHTRSVGCPTDHHPSIDCQRAGPIPQDRPKRSECELERDGVRATSETLSPPPRRPALTRDLQKGGDPAAGSPTATLLRLRPSH